MEGLKGSSRQTFLFKPKLHNRTTGDLWDKCVSWAVFDDTFCRNASL